MLRRFFVFLLVLTLLFVTSAVADLQLTLSVSSHQFVAGSSIHVGFTVSQDGNVDLVAVNQNGKKAAIILDKQKVSAGPNELSWDGMAEGKALPAGPYRLVLTMDDMSMDMDVTLLPGDGKAAPAADNAAAEEEPPAEETEAPVASQPQSAGSEMTPAYYSAYHLEKKHEACYWCTPMNIHDEAAVWAMLTAPVTILEGDQKEQVVVRKEASDSSEGVGVVTCTSQSVHVLEDAGNGWTLIETVSSSFHDSKVKAWNAFVTGYVPTSRLRKKTPSQEYGIVIDKLTQELYLFKEGHLFSRLLISTGAYDPDAKKLQPYNETRAGEFLFVSRVGEFRSDNMFCSMAIRFNSGDLLHEVPHVKNADGTMNYKKTEYKLGTRASHGCIRTQRLRNADGINMTWIWNNVSLGTKLAIWEDYAGRQMDLPDPATPLYYNVNGGSSYHSTPNCNGVRDEYLPLTGTFTYGELENEKYKKLDMCPYCIPPRRIAEIEAINKLHETVWPGEIPQN